MSIKQPYTATCLAGIANETLTSAGLDITGQDNFAFTLSPVGSAITALAVYWSLDAAGTRWSIADVDIAAAFVARSSSIADGSSFSFERPGTIKSRVRIVVTTTGDATVTVDVLAFQTGRQL